MKRTFKRTALICSLITSTSFLAFYINHRGDLAIQEIIENQAQFQRQVRVMEAKLKNINRVKLTVTAYSPQEKETDSTPLITAYQKPVKYGIIGISQDLEKLYGWKEGDEILLEGIGIFEVGDRMHYRWKRRIDVFHWDTQDAKNFGIKQVVGYKIGA